MIPLSKGALEAAERVLFECTGVPGPDPSWIERVAAVIDTATHEEAGKWATHICSRHQRNDPNCDICSPLRNMYAKVENTRKAYIKEGMLRAAKIAKKTRNHLYCEEAAEAILKAEEAIKVESTFDIKETVPVKIKQRSLYDPVYRAVQFWPNKKPWPARVMQENDDGEFIEDRYFVITNGPNAKVDNLSPGDWVMQDELRNTLGVIRKAEFERGWYAIEEPTDGKS